MAKRVGGHDPRQDPDEETLEETAERFRVDRVFAPLRERPPASDQPTTRAVHEPRTRTSSSSHPPYHSDDAELTLRRELAKLRRQLADAQRDLANKQDELAAEVEHRHLIGAARDKLISDNEMLEERIAELLNFQSRTVGLAEQLEEKRSEVDKLARALEVEETRHAETAHKLSEMIATLEDARIRRIEERAAAEERHADELERIESETREALEEAVRGHEAAMARMREGHEAAMSELRSGHDRSLATLRGELEPKVREARSLAEERERLASELTMAKSQAEHAKKTLTAEHAREIEQLTERTAGELATATRNHQAELTKVLGERDVEILEHQQTKRLAEVREREHGTALQALRDKEAQLNAAVAAAEERTATIAVEKSALDERLAASSHANDRLASENEGLRGRIDALEREVRKQAGDRDHLASLLQEALSVIGHGQASGPVVAPPKPDE